MLRRCTIIYIFDYLLFNSHPLMLYQSSIFQSPLMLRVANIVLYVSRLAIICNFVSIITFIFYLQLLYLKLRGKLYTLCVTLLLPLDYHDKISDTILLPLKLIYMKIYKRDVKRTFHPFEIWKINVHLSRNNFTHERRHLSIFRHGILVLSRARTSLHQRNFIAGSNFETTQTYTKSNFTSAREEDEEERWKERRTLRRGKFPQSETEKEENIGIRLYPCIQICFVERPRDALPRFWYSA